MDEETHVWRWRKDRIGETFRQVGVALVVTGVIALFFDPDSARGAYSAMSAGLFCLAVGWMD